MTDYIAVSDTQRIAVDFDFNAECPRGDWYMLTGAYSTEDRDPRLVAVVPVYEFPGDLHRAWSRAIWPSDEGLAVRWSKAFYSITLDYDSGTFWWADPEKLRESWPELVQGSAEYVIKEREVIEQEQRVYERWAEGDVYTVSLEELVKYVRITGDEIERDFTLDQWELVASISGNYLDVDYTAQQVANEYFGVSFGAA